MSATERALNLFQALDVNADGLLTMEEFIAGKLRSTIDNASKIDLHSEPYESIMSLETAQQHLQSINYIKQLGLKDDLRLSRGFSMETLCPHEYDIPLVRGVIWKDYMFSHF